MFFIDTVFISFCPLLKDASELFSRAYERGVFALVF